MDGKRKKVKIQTVKEFKWVKSFETLRKLENWSAIGTDDKTNYCLQKLSVT